MEEALDYIQPKDDDLIVKMTGRYYFEQSSHFMNLLQSLDLKKVKAIVKFGSFLRPSDKPVKDCITGLLMMSAAAVRNVSSWHNISAHPMASVEWAWAAQALKFPKEQLHSVQGPMGIMIAPGANKYFQV